MRQGAPLALTLVVSRVGPVGACEPLPDAHVDVWQCDAAGAYSGVEGGGGDAEAVSADWLRGFQLTDTNGRAQFLTIYPGWYTGRATHIHFKIRTDPGAEAGAEFTSQLFFDDALSDEVHAQPPYAARGAAGRPRNVDDAIFRDSGDQLTLDVRENSDGYEATFEIGIVLGGA